MRSIPKVPAHAKRRKYIKLAKGNFGGRRKLYETARITVERGWQYAYAHRKLRKREFRSLWTVRINAAARQLGVSYSRLVGLMKRANISINRKMLAAIAFEHPDVFKAVVETAMKLE